MTGAPSFFVFVNSINGQFIGTNSELQGLDKQGADTAVLMGVTQKTAVLVVVTGR